MQRASNAIRHIPIETEAVAQVDKQIRLENFVDQVLVGLVVGLLAINFVNQAERGQE